MNTKRLMIAGALVAASVGLGACATDGYYGGGYGGYYGYDNGYYGGYYDGYYDGYDPSYYGWYGDYYYPGTGYYVYDRNHVRHRWNNDQRDYWRHRGQHDQGGQGQGQRPHGGNWGGFHNQPQRNPNWHPTPHGSGTPAHIGGGNAGGGRHHH